MSVLDVAKYILGQSDKPMTTMKLQKLCYYSHAWHLVWQGKPLVAESFQAWANGPVCRPLFAAHRGRHMVDADSFPQGNADALMPEQAQVIADVLQGYLHLTGAQLSDLSHAEAPWLDARGALPASAPSDEVITDEAIRAFYGSLSEGDAGVEAVEDANWSDPWRVL